MSDSIFDPNEFMSAETNEAFTQRPRIPVGVELMGVIGEPKLDRFARKDDPNEFVYKLRVPVQVDLTTEPDVRELVGQDAVTVMDDLWVDFTPEKKLDTAPGRNRGLRRYREALDMNEGSFAIPMLQGRSVKVRIGQREGKDGAMYENIAAVSKP